MIIPPRLGPYLGAACAIFCGANCSAEGHQSLNGGDKTGKAESSEGQIIQPVAGENTFDWECANDTGCELLFRPASPAGTGSGQLEPVGAGRLVIGNDGESFSEDGDRVTLYVDGGGDLVLLPNQLLLPPRMLARLRLDVSTEVDGSLRVDLQEACTAGNTYEERTLSFEPVGPYSLPNPVEASETSASSMEAHYYQVSIDEATAHNLDGSDRSLYLEFDATSDLDYNVSVAPGCRPLASTGGYEPPAAATHIPAGETNRVSLPPPCRTFEVAVASFPTDARRDCGQKYKLTVGAAEE